MPEIINITKDSGIPLLGAIQFGIIDRGTNLLQVRSTTVCNMKCEFCSTNANNFDVHPFNFIVEESYLIDWLKQVVEAKENNIEIFIDSMGDPFTYPDFTKLIADIRKIKKVKTISTVTNGTFLTKELLNNLEKAGLDRINVSFHSFDDKLSKKLFGRPGYDVNQVLEMLKYIATTKIELIIVPVWIPKVNDDDILKIIKLAKELKCKVGIQKYEIYKYSRKMQGVKAINWWKFYKQIEDWEKETGFKLFMDKKDLDVVKQARLTSDFKKDEKLHVIIKSPGWIKNQMIGVAKNRCITINNCNKEIDDSVKIKIVENKNNIYIGEVC